MADLKQKNTRVFIGSLCVVLIMVGLSFAAVPLYRLFCQATGFGGTTQVSDLLPDQQSDRKINVSFNAYTHRDLFWDFKPETKRITVHVGEKGIANYTAKNVTNAVTVGTAVYNVTPLKAGKYFYKIACFCFDEQVLNPWETVDMPVMFYIHPDILDDPNMDDVHDITLSYTFFKPSTKAYDAALEEFYDRPDDAITPMIGN